MLYFHLHRYRKIKENNLLQTKVKQIFTCDLILLKNYWYWNINTGKFTFTKIFRTSS